MLQSRPMFEFTLHWKEGGQTVISCAVEHEQMSGKVIRSGEGERVELVRTKSSRLRWSSARHKFHDRSEHALDPMCESLPVVTALLSEISQAGYSHPSVECLHQKQWLLSCRIISAVSQTHLGREP